MKEENYINIALVIATVIMAITSVIMANSSISSSSIAANLASIQTTPKLDFYITSNTREFPISYCSSLIDCSDPKYDCSKSSGLIIGNELVGDTKFFIRVANIGLMPIHVHSIYFDSDCIYDGKSIEIVPIPESKKLSLSSGEILDINYTFSENFYANRTSCHFNFIVESNVKETSSCRFTIKK